MAVPFPFEYGTILEEYLEYSHKKIAVEAMDWLVQT